MQQMRQNNVQDYLELVNPNQQHLNYDALIVNVVLQMHHRCYHKDINLLVQHRSSLLFDRQQSSQHQRHDRNETNFFRFFRIDRTIILIQISLQIITIITTVHKAIVRSVTVKNFFPIMM